MNILLKKPIVKFFKAYYALRENNFIWGSILNRKARSLYAHSNRACDEITREIVGEIRESGISIRHADDFNLEDNFRVLQTCTEVHWESAEVSKRFHERKELSKDGSNNTTDCYLIDMLPTQRILDLEDPFIKFSLHGRILGVVNHYMEMYSKLLFWELKCAVSKIHIQESIQSQIWHRDRGDKKMLKVFLYLNDVDNANGPFTYLKFSQEGGRWNKLHTRTPPVGAVGDPYLIPHKDIQICTGKAGTIIFADTSGLHCGGSVTSAKRRRFMYTSAYVSEASVWPPRYIKNSHRHEKTLNPEARYAIANAGKKRRQPCFYRELLHEINARS